MEYTELASYPDCNKVLPFLRGYEPTRLVSYGDNRQRLRRVVHLPGIARIVDALANNLLAVRAIVYRLAVVGSLYFCSSSPIICLTNLVTISSRSKLFGLLLIILWTSSNAS